LSKLIVTQEKVVGRLSQEVGILNIASSLPWQVCIQALFSSLNSHATGNNSFLTNSVSIIKKLQLSWQKFDFVILLLKSHTIYLVAREKVLIEKRYTSGESFLSNSLQGMAAEKST
jgi:hypothetical protein